MNKLLRSAIIIGFIISPIIIGVAISHTQPKDSDYGLVLIFYLIAGIPAIALIGLIVSFLSRRSINANNYSFSGYGVPALMVAGLEVCVAISR